MPAPTSHQSDSTEPTALITRAQLGAVLLQLEKDFRDGKTQSHEEGLALSAEQVSTERADHLWACLTTKAE